MERRLVRIIKANQKKNSKIALKIVSYDTGNFGIFCPNIFYKNEKIVFSQDLKLPRTRSVDTDTMEDWNLAIKLCK